MSDTLPPLTNEYSGHRQRLKERFLASARAESPDSLKDYEYLELLLFLGIPRRDVKPLAKGLLARFGSVGGVLSAEPDQLVALVGESGAVALKTAAAAATWMLREEVLDKPVLASWDRVLDYCHATMAHRETECFRVLFLDRKNRLIVEEVMQKGTIDHTPVYPREVIRRALELGASALIMVHNHPSGDPQPSKADIDITRQIRDAARPLGVILHDHVIIARTGYSSFKSDGLI
ncbi:MULTISPECIES: RadC family protein [unclassified Haematospirillum]|uniref:RadC family protein n=1 Tax=unclassified Haematospirillum TaxID=2622088 RepID=UPI001439AFF8|nr:MULTISPECIES: DNA repair protein RadC [unclassified Haematospirillum]NKD54929.1 DNA repair protein RadC [Haematospirillum sp. H4890]NKD74950.1 DNA repair protein RadC [Haematospirillum sp. H4485]NKD87861.1 DNA repair protein RadC [Haematospirillum sp. 15-248]